MTQVLTLPWLLPAPADFRQRLKDQKALDHPDPAALRRLANSSLSGDQLRQMGRLLGTCEAGQLVAGGLRPARLGICGTHTVDFILEALPATGLRHGLAIQAHAVPFGQAAQQVLDPGSALAAWNPDFVYLSFDAAALGLAEPILDEAAAGAAVDAAIAQIASLRNAIRNTVGATAVLQTIAAPLPGLFGNFDARLPGSPRALAARFNARLATEVADPADLLLDLAGLAELVGTATWFDAMRWHDAKIPFALEAVPLFADHLCRLLAAARGLSRKCLVLDLDNTLWGGVIGDDGVEGIKLGQGSARGEAHLAIQRHALHLRSRGIVLAVCSKNEEAAALLPFDQHDEMVLKREHISAFVANWTDKASNLKAIAKTLNIGTDALVFLDDNPAERERVRQEMPEVAVPEVGDEPSDYVRLLAMAGYFEAIAFGDDDRQRADMYQANSLRALAVQQAGNLDEYLQSLDMVCTISPFNALGRSRIASLVNKSNQFNLTTRRYTEVDVAAIEADPLRLDLQVRLVDRFGDNGMISVVVFDRGEAEWVCDTWLMSCRVLGRRVEEAVLAYVAQQARAAGARRLVGHYLPTPKNVIVEHHFEKLGFAPDGELAGGGTRWVLALSDYKPPDLPMQVIAGGSPAETAQA